MCGRIGLPQLTWAQFIAWQRGELNWSDFVRDGPEALCQSFNVKPTQQVEISYLNKGQPYSTTAQWWFVPHWFKGVNKDWTATTFNARIESAFEKPTFRTAWKHARCLIPAIGYFEWTSEGRQKQPWWITTKRNAPALFFAGLYSKRQEGHTCTILTRAALPQIKHIHNRSPVILEGEGARAWISGHAYSDEEQQNLGAEWDGRMSFHKVSPFKRDDDGPQLIEEFNTLL